MVLRVRRDRKMDVERCRIDHVDSWNWAVSHSTEENVPVTFFIALLTLSLSHPWMIALPIFT